MPDFTGERVVPGLVDADLFNEHAARYEFAARFASGKTVLDAGCGSGYGSAELAKTARQVTGIDFSRDAIEYAQANYRAPNLTFSAGDCTALPSGPFDLIVAFEVIEHLSGWKTFLQEARRALAPDGSFLVSTPNKVYYAESRGECGENPFHVHEFEYSEFQSELQSVFPHVSMFVQNHVEGVAFSPLANAARPEFKANSTQSSPSEAHFFVALCSAQPLPAASPFIWMPGTGNLLREREHHIGLLTDEVAMKTAWLQKSKAELDTLLPMFRKANAQVEERSQWALQARAEAEERGARIVELQHEIAQAQTDFARIAAEYEEKMAELEANNRAKTEWALETERRLTAELQEFAQCVTLLDTAEANVVERTLWAQSLQRQVEFLQSQMAEVRSARWVRVGSKLKLVPEQQ